MYERYWKFDRVPFDHDRRSDAFFHSQRHGEAIVKLKYLIEHQKGAAAVIGASGTGKTHILEQMRQTIDNHPLVPIVYPQLSPQELVSLIVSSLADDSGPSTAAGLPMDLLLQTLDAKLCELTVAGRSPVIVIDDAHLIEDRRVFQSLHQLMNYQRPGRSNFSLILAGQPQLVDTLQRNDQLSDRIAFSCLLHSFSAAETTAYVRHRLHAAGRMEPIFDDAAMKSIYELSSGIPRRINRLCDFALLVGYANQLTTVTAAQIEGVHSEITQSPIAA